MNKTQRNGKDRLTWRGISAVAVILLFFVFGLFWRGRGRSVAPPPSGRQPNTATEPSVPPPSTAVPPTPVKTPPRPSPTPLEVPSVPEESDVSPASAPETPIPAHSRPRERAARAAGARRVVFVDGTEGEIRPRRLFKNHFDSALLGAGRPGGMTTGLRAQLLRLGDEGFMEMLRAPVEIVDEEDEYARETGIAVAQFKRDLLVYIEQGATPEQAVSELSARSSEERQMRVEAIRQLNALARSGDEEVVRKYIEEVNALFEEQGMAPLRRATGGE